MAYNLLHEAVRNNPLKLSHIHCTWNIYYNRHHSLLCTLRASIYLQILTNVQAIHVTITQHVKMAPISSRVCPGENTTAGIPILNAPILNAEGWLSNILCI